MARALPFQACVARVASGCCRTDIIIPSRTSDLDHDGSQHVPGHLLHTFLIDDRQYQRWLCFGEHHDDQNKKVDSSHRHSRYCLFDMRRCINYLQEQSQTSKGTYIFYYFVICNHFPYHQPCLLRKYICPITNGYSSNGLFLILTHQRLRKITSKTNSLLKVMVFKPFDVIVRTSTNFLSKFYHQTMMTSF